MDFEGRTEAEIAGDGRAQKHAGQAKAAGGASLRGIGPLRVDTVEIVSPGRGDRVEAVETHQFEIGAELELMAASQPGNVILGLPGVLRDAARLGTGERSDIRRTAALDGETCADHIVLDVDRGEFFV